MCVAKCYISDMGKLDQILQDMQGLSEDERLTLAHHLLAADEGEPTVEIEQAWDLEIRERIARYDRGETTARPVADVLADLDRQLKS